MREYRYLSVEQDDGVVVCRLSNPPAHTLVAPAVGELQQVVDDLTRDDRVIVFTGTGDGVFIAHYEVGELAESAESGSRPASGGGLHAFHRLCLSLERSPAVTVAAINGNAAGGGFEFALACDFRLMLSGPYQVGLPETSVGIIPGAGGTQRYARLLGTARALDLILHGRLLDPDAALELGLVHRLFDAAQFGEEVRAFAINLASRAPVALAAAKRAIRDGVQGTLEAGLGVEQVAFETCMASRDARVALRSWLEGKSWTWTGE